MQNKFVMAGMFVGGVVFGWAVMADKAERDKKQMLEEFEGFVKERDSEWERALMDKTEQIFALKHQVVSQQIKQEQAEIPSFREGRLLTPEEVLTNTVQTIDLNKEFQEAIPDGTTVEFVLEPLRLVPEAETHISNAQEDLAGEDPGDAEVDDNDFEEPIIDETLEETRSNLQALIDEYTSSPEKQEEFVEHAMQAIEADRRPPFVIGKDEYAYGEDGEHFDKVSILYYPNERVLLDDDDEPIADVNLIVGWKNLKSFGEDSGDPDVVFIRNPRMETDFEVIRQEPDKALPLHVRYGMDASTFNSRKAAGLLRLRPEDVD